MKHVDPLQLEIDLLDQRVSACSFRGQGREVRLDLWALLDTNRSVAPTIRKRAQEGLIDGSTYSGRCCCLKGIAHQCGSYKMTAGMSPIEVFIRGVHPGMTTKNSLVLELVVEMVDMWDEQPRQGQ